VTKGLQTRFMRAKGKEAIYHPMEGGSTRLKGAAGGGDGLRLERVASETVTPPVSHSREIVRPTPHPPGEGGMEKSST